MADQQHVAEQIQRALTSGLAQIVDTVGTVHSIHDPTLTVGEGPQALHFAPLGDREPLSFSAQSIAGVRTSETRDRVWQVAFFDQLPESVFDVIEPSIRALGDHGHPLARAALLSYPTAIHPNLVGAVDALDAAERAAVRGAVELAMREPSDLLLGWLLAAGLCADTATILRLGDLLVGNCEFDIARRAAFALEALRLCGTTEAHMQIQRAASEAVASETIGWARHALLCIAGDKRIPVWEVEDELVPTCGLSREAVVVDYGERGFELSLDENLRPFLHEPERRERFYDAPQMVHGEGVDTVERGRARWRVLREQLNEAIPVQVHRLEEALIQEYRWDALRWSERVCKQPLLRHLVGRCVWGHYSASGRKLHGTFRVEADGTLWSHDDEPFELQTTDRSVGLVHPLDLDEPTRHAWGAILADYEVVTLFPQIDRAVYRYAPEDSKSTRIELAIDSEALAFDCNVHLHRRGWRVFQRWGAQLAKTFRSCNIRARADIDFENNRLNTIQALWFERYLGYPNTTFQLRDVPAVVYSEAVLEFESLRTKHDTGAFSAIGSFKS